MIFLAIIINLFIKLLIILFFFLLRNSLIFNLLVLNIIYFDQTIIVNLKIIKIKEALYFINFVKFKLIFKYLYYKNMFLRL